MPLPSGYQALIESWQFLPGKPYNQALAVPATTRSWFYSGILMQGVIPYGMSMVPYYEAAREPWSVQRPLTAPVYYGSNRVFSGTAPVRGIYTGVK